VLFLLKNKTYGGGDHVNPNWQEIRREWEATNATFKELADKHGIKDATIRSRKNREQWQRNATPSSATQRKNVATKKQDTVTPKSEDSLTDKQRLFVREYLVDLNATQAAIRAGYSADTADVQGPRLLGNVRVSEAIDDALTKREQRIEITQDMVLQRWWAIANADPNDLVHLRRLCCRYCFGYDHHYQWLDEAEYQAAVRREMKASKEEDREPLLPSDAGGYGFDKTLRPHPKCPQCGGEGRLSVYMEDTKHTTPEGRLLYAGIKETKDGIEIKMRNQDKALELVARHLGMFDDRANKGKPDSQAQITALADLINNPAPERVLDDD